MITPAKWQTAEADQKIASKMSYGEFRQKIVPHMSKVVFYPDCKDVFDNAIQTDGISWYIVDKHNTYTVTFVTNKCSLKSILDSMDTRSILNKETLLNKADAIIKYIGTYDKYNIEQELSGRYEVYISDMLPGSGFYRLSERNTGIIVISPYSVVDSQTGKVYSQKGTQSGTDSSVTKCLFRSDNLDECKSFISWLYSKFIRFFIICNISTRSIFNSNTFRFVPAPPSGKFDHIYTDKELYEAFNLPQKYIDVIESVIKERK